MSNIGKRLWKWLSDNKSQLEVLLALFQALVIALGFLFTYLEISDKGHLAKREAISRTFSLFREVAIREEALDSAVRLTSIYTESRQEAPYITPLTDSLRPAILPLRNLLLEAVACVNSGACDEYLSANLFCRPAIRIAEIDSWIESAKGVHPGPQLPIVHFAAGCLPGYVSSSEYVADWVRWYIRLYPPSSRADSLRLAAYARRHF